MSLEDTPSNPMDDMDKGDKVCTILPGFVWEVFPEEGYIMNHHMQSQSFFVEIVPSNAMSKSPKRQHWIIHLMPLSRRDDLAPSEGV